MGNGHDGSSGLLVGSDYSLGRTVAEQMHCSEHGAQKQWLTVDEEPFCTVCIKELLRRSIPVLEDSEVTSES